MSQDEMHSLLNEIDLTYHGKMELQDYMQVNQETYIYTQCAFFYLRSSSEIRKYPVRNFTKFCVKSTPI